MVSVCALHLDHGHIAQICAGLRAAGARIAAVHEPDPAVLAGFRAQFPEAAVLASAADGLDAGGVDLVACAAVPDQRSAIAIRALASGKHVILAKPACTSLAQLDALRAAQRASGRRVWIWYAERLASAACTRASALVAAGAIGRVIDIVGLGPHRLGSGRPAWTFERERTGGILCDLASHQAEQFLHYAGSASACVVAASIAARDPQRPGFQDVGSLLLRSADGVTGYHRVDWRTPAGLRTWGDNRLFLAGTEGTIELRKTIDPGAAAHGEHLIVVDGAGERHLDCRGEATPFLAQVVADITDGSDSAMPQAHAFLATELALRAQVLAEAGR